MGDSPANTSFSLPVDESQGLGTGVAFFNNNGVGANLQIEFVEESQDGASASSTGNLSGRGSTTVGRNLPSFGHQALFVSGLLPSSGGRRGQLAVTSDQPISALTLRQGQTALTSLPVSPGVFGGENDFVRTETGVDLAQVQLGVSGKDTIIAVLDRGIDWQHPDFIGPDGGSRILYIVDLSDDSGAGAPDNPIRAGTIYSKAEIDAALNGGPPLPTRDAVGHGTATAGIAGGNGRASGGRYLGMAPEACFIIVKFTSEGAQAHDGEPAESPFFASQFLAPTLDFINAGGVLGQGQTIDLQINKGHPGNLRFNLWYPESDRFEVEIVTPSGTAGPFAAPAQSNGSTSESGASFSYFHNGGAADFFGSTSDNREILIDFNGPPGDYIVRLRGTDVSDGTFDAILNPSNIFSAPENRFESFVDPGHTIWDWASAINNIAPNSYVLNQSWRDINGIVRTHVGNDVGPGELWPGSGVGPTFDGRTGIAVSAPGNSNITPFAPNSIFALGGGSLIEGGEGLHGVLAFVSGAAPVLTGIIALMLEADPTLDATQVKDILQRTARRDDFTGPFVNTEWGHGKIDAEAAVREALEANN